MKTKVLTSLTNPVIKYLRNLRMDKKFRENEGKLLIVGFKIVEELILANYPISSYISTSLTPICKINCKEQYCITKDMFQKISGLDSSEEIAVVVPKPMHSNFSKSLSSVLVLDGVQDPGNMGTLIRSALGLSWSSVFITKNSCDPFNEKVLRATKGANFHIPIREGVMPEILNLTRGHSVYVADIRGDSYLDIPSKNSGNPGIPSRQPGKVLILGNESHGVTSSIPDTAIKLKIPLHPSVDSLNVAAAGAILMSYLQYKS